MKKIYLITIILAVLLVLAVGYIGYTILKIEFYDKGFREGSEYFILQIYKAASSCQQVPLTFNNQTINLFAVECLQQQENK